MSWQAYVDNLIGTGKIDRAAIYSKAGDSVWAQSPGFGASAAEIAAIVQGFDDPSGLQASGLYVEGQKYFLIRADDRSIYGKHDESGLIAVRTKLSVIIAHYSPPSLPGEATTAVEKFADYLISVNY